MEALARFVVARRWWVVGGWLLLAVLGGVGAPQATGALSYDFGLPGQPGYETNQQIVERFGSGGANAPILLVVGDGSASVDASAGDTVAAAAAQAAPGARVTTWSETPDLLAAVPFLLGFHPEESLVALFLQAGRVLLTARYDLGQPTDLDLSDLVEQHRPSGLLLVVYCADVGRGRTVLRAQAEVLGSRLGTAPGDPVDLVDLLLVDGRRWWSLTCSAGCLHQHKIWKY